VRQGQGGENRPARLDAPLSLALCLAGENACPPPYADIGQHGRLKKKPSQMTWLLLEKTDFISAFYCC